MLLDVVSGVGSTTYISANTVSGYLQDIETDGVVISGGGSMYVNSGGIANNTHLDGGTLYVSSGAVLNSTVISRGVLSIGGSGIILNDTTVLSGGRVSYQSSILQRNSFSNTVFKSGAIVNGFYITEDSIIESDFIISNVTPYSGDDKLAFLLYNS